MINDNLIEWLLKPSTDNILQEKAKNEFQILKDNKKPLSNEEHKEVMDGKAIWHHNGGKPSPAVWKSIDKNGKVIYVTNTHRAFNTASTLKGAIERYHKFIKSTA